MQRFIVPVDGSSASWAAVDVAAALARQLEALVHVVEVTFDPDEVGTIERRLDERIVGIDADVDVAREVRLSGHTVASALEELVDLHPGATLVMASHGHGRSAALVGSVAEDVLQRTFGPIMLVGPEVTTDSFDGPVVVTVDGSDESETALPLAAAWAIELGVHAWVTHVLPPGSTTPDNDLVDSAYPARLAHNLSVLSGHEIEFEELHDDHPAKAVRRFAQGLGASLIVSTSHGRSGFSRLTQGSVTADLVRSATCPVLVARLPSNSRPDPSKRLASRRG